MSTCISIRLSNWLINVNDNGVSITIINFTEEQNLHTRLENYQMFDVEDHLSDMHLCSWLTVAKEHSCEMR